MLDPLDMVNHARHAEAPQSIRGQDLPPGQQRLRDLNQIAQLSEYRRGQEICAEFHAATSWFSLVSGAARRYVIRDDGRRQILDLLFPGDFFGYTMCTEYDFTVEAVTQGTVVASYPRRSVEMLADSNPLLARELRKLAIEAMERAKMQLLILGRVTATEKVASFLVAMAARSPGPSENRLTLPVSRYDIADYLALSVETVSRSLTVLKRRGVIALPTTRSVKIMNWSALEPGSG
jgi:CRP/FNR family nitrogen fixation transcriptional regulator